MRNLKRALSLVLAMVMIVGMMTMGASAGNFKDADAIVNKEAVEIVAGLGLFAGDTEGNFLPTSTVTRAQMATIIVKMLYGSDINADAYKGNGKFSDTASFEGGWAEGYINMCASAGIVSGYGDGTFGPGNAVTTAEAVTMIINALKVDAGEGQWPITVMVKAEEIKLFEDLSPKPASDAALTRDQLAVVSLNGLNYSPEGKTTYVVDGVKFTDAAAAFMAAMVSGSEVEIIPGEDSLAGKTYGLKMATGTIVANQETGKDYTELSNGGLFAIETGLDMIGHYVTVYYKDEWESEEEPGKTYTLVDEAKYIVVEEDTEDAKDYKKAFAKSYALADNGFVFDGNYVATEYDADDFTVSGYVRNESALAGTYVVFENKIIGYIEPATVYASRVLNVNTTAGQEAITLNGVSGALDNTAENDMVVEYDGIAAGDYVTYINAQGTYVLSQITKVSGKITKIANNNDGIQVVTISDKEYEAFQGVNNSGKKSEIATSDFNFDSTYRLLVTAEGEYIGYETAQAAVRLKNVYYILGGYQLEGAKDAYGNPTTLTYAHGVDTDGDEASILVGVVNQKGSYGVNDVDAIGKGFWSAADATEREAAKLEIKVLSRMSGTYDPDKSPLYVVAYKWDNVTFTGNGTLADNTFGYSYTDTTFIAVQGEPGSKLETASTTGSSTAIYIPSGGFKPLILCSRDASGSVNMEVVVVETTPTVIAGGKNVYLAATNEDASLAVPTGRNAEGFTYEAYDADTAEAVDFVMATGNALTPGFYKAVMDKETGLYEVDERLPDETKINDRYAYHEEAYRYLNATHGNMVCWGEAINVKASSAKVVDLRSEEQILKDGIPAITSVADITALAAANPSIVIFMDLFETAVAPAHVTAIFVTKVVVGTPGIGAVMYRADASKNEFVVVNNLGMSSGSLVELDLADFNITNADKAKAGFFAIEADGNALALVYVGGQDGGDYRFTMGYHNEVLVYDEGVLYTVDAHTDDTCGAGCINTPGTAAVLEAPGTLQIKESSLTVMDLRDVPAAEKLNSLSAIVEAAEDGDQVIIDWYCSETAAANVGPVDFVPEFIFVYEVNAGEGTGLATPEVGTVLQSAADLAASGVAKFNVTRTEDDDIDAGSDINVMYVVDGDTDAGYFEVTAVSGTTVTIERMEDVVEEMIAYGFGMEYGVVTQYNDGDLQATLQTAVDFYYLSGDGEDMEVGDSITIPAGTKISVNSGSGIDNTETRDVQGNQFYIVTKTIPAATGEAEYAVKAMKLFYDDAKFTRGYHNVVVSLSSTTLVTEDAHCQHSGANHCFECVNNPSLAASWKLHNEIFGGPCYDTANRICEAAKTLTVNANTPVYQMVDGVLTNIGISGLTTLIATKDVLVDYYVAGAESVEDDEPTAIFVNKVADKGTPYYVPSTGDVITVKETVGYASSNQGTITVITVGTTDYLMRIDNYDGTSIAAGEYTCTVNADGIVSIAPVAP